MALPTITPYTTVPLHTMEREEFESAFAIRLAEESTNVTEMNALAAAMDALAADSDANAIAAVSSASAAEQSALIALAAANFKGSYSAMEGTATVPYSVYHEVSGTTGFWSLANDLADITAKVPGVDVEWIEINLLSSIDTILLPIKTNIILNAFQIAINGGLAVMSMSDGFSDRYQDETGIDTTNSVNQIYDSVDVGYHNQDQTTSYANTGGTGDRTAIISVSGGGGIVLAPDTTILNGNTANGYVSFAGSPYGAYIDFDFGSPVLFDAFRLYGDDVADAGTYKWQGRNDGGSFQDVGYDFSLVSSATGAAHALSNTDAYRYYRLVLLTGMPVSCIWYEMEFQIIAAGGTALELISTSETALASPDDGFIVIRHESDETITLNTDVQAYVSRESGDPESIFWTQVSLAQEAVIDNAQILVGTADLSGQASGTDMRYKIMTPTSKKQYFSGTALQWS